MVLNPDDRAEFEQEWQKKVAETAEYSRWNPNVLGPGIEDYRQTPAYEDIKKIFKEAFGTIKKEAAKYGLTEADFWDAVRKKAVSESENMPMKEQAEFYKQTEAEFEKDKRRDSRNENFKIHQIFRGALRRIGWFPKLTKSSYKGEKVKKLDRALNANYIKDLHKKIEEKNEEIAKIDEELKNTAAKIKILESKLQQSKDEKEREQNLDDINEIRKKMKEKTEEKIKIIHEVQADEEKYNLMMGLIADELAIENKIIGRKWGGKIEKLTNKKQKLIEELNKAEKGENKLKEQKLRTEMRKIDLELDKIKKEIIDYKVKRPIFLFERFVGTQSISLVDKFEKTKSDKKEATESKQLAFYFLKNKNSEPTPEEKSKTENPPYKIPYSKTRQGESDKKFDEKGKEALEQLELDPEINPEDLTETDVEKAFKQTINKFNICVDGMIINEKQYNILLQAKKLLILKIKSLHVGGSGEIIELVEEIDRLKKEIKDLQEKDKKEKPKLQPKPTPGEADALKRRIAELEAENKGLKDSNKNLKSEVKTLGDSNTQLKSEIEAKTKEIEDLKAEITDKKIRIQALDEANKRLAKMIEDLEKQNPDLEKIIKELREQLAKANQEQQRLSDRVKELSGELAEKTRETKALVKTITAKNEKIGELDEESQRLNDQIRELDGKLAESEKAKEKVKELEELLALNSDKRRELELNLNAERERNSELREEIRTVKDERDQLKETLDGLTAQILELQDEKGKLMKRVDELEKQLSDTEGVNQELIQELKEAKEMLEDKITALEIVLSERDQIRDKLEKLNEDYAALNKAKDEMEANFRKSLDEMNRLYNEELDRSEKLEADIVRLSAELEETNALLSDSEGENAVLIQRKKELEAEIARLKGIASKHQEIVNKLVKPRDENLRKVKVKRKRREKIKKEIKERSEILGTQATITTSLQTKDMFQELKKSIKEKPHLVKALTMIEEAIEKENDELDKLDQLADQNSKKLQKLLEHDPKLTYTDGDIVQLKKMLKAISKPQRNILKEMKELLKEKPKEDISQEVKKRSDSQKSQKQLEAFNKLMDEIDPEAIQKTKEKYKKRKDPDSE